MTHGSLIPAIPMPGRGGTHWVARVMRKALPFAVLLGATVAGCIGDSAPNPENSAGPEVPVALDLADALVTTRAMPVAELERVATREATRRALEKRTKPDPARYFEHYVSLLEQHPNRIAREQTHLFAAMNLARSAGGVDAAVRLKRRLSRLEAAAASQDAASSPETRRPTRNARPPSSKQRPGEARGVAAKGAASRRRTPRSSERCRARAESRAFS